ncbi:MAG: Nif3-like dinuclear metal center hexameric protein [Clostridia bacterium]|nr:Nif3-like dinuclear metal center hexameric protein [Clostridia bacterium]
MKARDLIDELEKVGSAPDVTCDTVKSGDPDKEIKKVAVSMFATVKNIKEISAWGADMLLVHEPTYYDHLEAGNVTPVTEAKRELVEKSGMVIYRHHDRMHAGEPDGIAEGELYYLGLRGRVEKTPYFASYLMTLDEPKTALELADLMESELGIKHVRIAGERSKKAKNIALCFGTPGGVFELLCNDGVDAVLVGEACEWQVAEYARDAAELGINKSLVVMGHIGSERDGMRLLTKRLSEAHPELEFKYFECGEVYSYTEDKNS